jgi:hypothetical protein
MRDGLSQHVITHLVGKRLNISILANVHHLRYHPLWHLHRLVR